PTDRLDVRHDESGRLCARADRRRPSECRPGRAAAVPGDGRQQPATIPPAFAEPTPRRPHLRLVERRAKSPVGRVSRPVHLSTSTDMDGPQSPSGAIGWQKGAGRRYNVPDSLATVPMTLP